MKILIVDDERAIRNSLKEILGDEGYDVDVAEDGPSALAKVDKEKFDVTILCEDYRPNSNIYKVLKENDVKIVSALNDDSRAQIEALAEELAAAYR